MLGKLRWKCATHHAMGQEDAGCPKCVSEALLIASEALVRISLGNFAWRIDERGLCVVETSRDVVDGALAKIQRIDERTTKASNQPVDYAKDKQPAPESR